MGDLFILTFSSQSDGAYSTPELTNKAHTSKLVEFQNSLVDYLSHQEDAIQNRIDLSREEYKCKTKLPPTMPTGAKAGVLDSKMRGRV